jgi:hypothetical protein
MDGVSASTWAKAVRKPAVAQLDTGKAAWSGYRSVRVLPTN